MDQEQALTARSHPIILAHLLNFNPTRKKEKTVITATLSLQVHIFDSKQGLIFPQAFQQSIYKSTTVCGYKKTQGKHRRVLNDGPEFKGVCGLRMTRRTSH